MNWIWIPAVVLVGVVLVALCFLFFNDYTCCPCKKKRPPASYDASRSPSPFISLQIGDSPDIRPGYIPSTPITQSSSLPSYPFDRPTHIHTRPRPPPPPVPAKPRGAVPGLTPSLTYDFRGIASVGSVIKMEGGVPAIDLHKMRVKEAVRITESFLQQSKGHYRRVRIITGRGLHSENQEPKIKPAIESLLSGRKYKEISMGGCLEVMI